ncbi:MAG: DUF2779 domain-containing protein [Gammaproteobacteria bacterium]|jgi:CRISPR/Cas system-associated exonuclease Cas4 (RecB family)
MITKTNFLSFLQCPKRLWLEENNPKKAKTKTPTDTWRSVQGREVGELAQKFFPDGIRVDFKDKTAACTQTKNLIESGKKIIFEASFLANDCYAAIDILQKNNNGWNIVEVKSATSLKDEHIIDIAFQKFVAIAAGIKVNNCILMHINKENAYPNTNDLFIQKNITEEVNEYINLIPKEILSFQKTISNSQEPKILFGKYCKEPHLCQFKNYCWQNVIKLPYIRLPKQLELYTAGVRCYKDIPIDYELSPKAQAALNQIRSNKITINKQQIKDQLETLEYPLYFLDFEFDNPAVPRFNDFHPYEEFPFQFSCHVLDKTNKLNHYEFIQPDFSDSRLELIKQLIACIGEHGHVIAWNISAEKKVLKKLAKEFPKYSNKLLSIANRLWDQLPIFRTDYLHPAFICSQSIKNVLPMLAPNLNYKNLSVQSGTDAQAIWNKMLRTKNKSKKEDMIKNLKEYCHLDTWGMVKIHEALLKIIA